MSAFTQSLIHRKLGLVAMVVLVAALAGGITAGAVLGSGSGSPPTAEPPDPELDRAAITTTGGGITQIGPPTSVTVASPPATGGQAILAFDEAEGGHP